MSAHPGQQRLDGRRPGMDPAAGMNGLQRILCEMSPDAEWSEVVAEAERQGVPPFDTDRRAKWRPDG